VLFAMHVGDYEVVFGDGLDVFASVLLFEVDGILIGWYFRLLPEDLVS